MTDLAPLAELHPMPSQLETVAKIIEGWIEWDRTHRRAEGLTTNDGTHLMSLPTPCWPSHGQFQRWIELLRNAAKIEQDNKAAADERQAAIVAWLRDPPEKQFVRDVAYLLADAIESGEWKGQG